MITKLPLNSASALGSAASKLIQKIISFINSALVVKFKLLFFLFFMAIFCQEVDAQFTITENFKNNSTGNVTIGGNAVLTSGSIDPVGNGWLRLTNDVLLTNGQLGYGYVNQSFPSTLGVSIDFEYVSWRTVNPTSGADGFSVFLFDATTPSFSIGGAGGAWDIQTVPV